MQCKLIFCISFNPDISCFSQRRWCQVYDIQPKPSPTSAKAHYPPSPKRKLCLSFRRASSVTFTPASSSSINIQGKTPSTISARKEWQFGYQEGNNYLWLTGIQELSTDTSLLSVFPSSCTSRVSCRHTNLETRSHTNSLCIID